ncbi:unnamed protein product [Pararhodospirillum photometricum DSM 122]|uniref:Uncharacterized protein n=1 Tax=Pararhodospirillum photometricum DSM 122 TaxID=1150469 RepID=H6SPB3_PARPM|nr:unnamed protein product [Pararhodospirillum photometricum DSM 122]
MGGDPGPHDAGPQDGNLADVAHHIASKMVAMPWPPPMHWVARA